MSYTSVTADAGTGGDSFNVDKVGGVDTPVTKIAHGVEGTITPVTGAAPLPVTAIVASGGVASGAIASGAVASGAFASGALASGSVASGALASGSVADGAMVTLGAKADAKSTATDTTAITAMSVWKQISSSVQALVTGATALGQTTASASLPVTLASNDAIAGGLTETAPATDTASSGLNGRLQRIAQRLTSLLAKLPALGTAGAASTDVITIQGIASGTVVPISVATIPSHAVTNAGTFATQSAATLASGAVSSGAVASGAFASGALASGSVASGALASGSVASGAIVDGAHVTIGAKADAKSTATDTTAITAMSVWKQISSSVQSLVTGATALGQTTAANSLPVTLASNQPRLPIEPKILVVAGSAMTRPANTTAYSALDAVSDNATAGSVTANSITLSDVNDDPVSIDEALMVSTDTGFGGKSLRLYLYNANPTSSTGVVGGDNAAFSNKQAGFIGSMIGTMLTFSDGSRGRFLPEAGMRILTTPTSGAKTLFWQLQTLDAATPSANSTTFTPTIKGFQGRAA